MGVLLIWDYVNLWFDIGSEKLAGAVFTEAYKELLRILVALRQDAGLSQANLAAQVGKPPSFVAKYELGERRLDVVELLVLLKAMGADAEATLDPINSFLPEKLK